MPRDKRTQVLDSLTDEQAFDLLFDWRFWARTNQLAPEGKWSTWLILAGRGFGKTRSGAEWVRERAEANPNARIALIGRTAADVRDVMICGESGILAVCPPWFKPEYIENKRLLKFPNGAIATAYSAEKPDQLRGPQHTDGWGDELAAWRYEMAWSNFVMGLRLGADPQACVTTTPRNVPLLKKLLKRKSTVVTKGSTFENIGNLAESFIEEVIDQFAGTRLGRQELEAELLDDNPDALWKREAMIEAQRFRVDHKSELSPLEQLCAQKHITRIAVGCDPSTTSAETSAETGIIVAACDNAGHYYVLDDCSVRDTPLVWARAVVRAYNAYGAHRVVGEVNQGGDMIEAMIRRVADDIQREEAEGLSAEEGERIAVAARNVAYTAVRASQSKVTRAEPISALYEQGRVHHVGSFATLEDQMCNWTPGDTSPDRLDALVWVLTELSGRSMGTTRTGKSIY